MMQRRFQQVHTNLRLTNLVYASKHTTHKSKQERTHETEQAAVNKVENDRVTTNELDKYPCSNKVVLHKSVMYLVPVRHRCSSSLFQAWWLVILNTINEQACSSLWQDELATQIWSALLRTRTSCSDTSISECVVFKIMIQSQPSWDGRSFGSSSPCFDTWKYRTKCWRARK